MAETSIGNMKWLQRNRTYSDTNCSADRFDWNCRKFITEVAKTTKGVEKQVIIGLCLYYPIMPLENIWI